MMATHGVDRLLVKELAPNDNSKNQPYVAKDEYSAFNILPVGEITTGMSEDGMSLSRQPFLFIGFSQMRRLPKLRTPNLFSTRSTRR